MDYLLYIFPFIFQSFYYKSLHYTIFLDWKKITNNNKDYWNCIYLLVQQSVKVCFLRCQTDLDLNQVIVRFGLVILQIH